MARKKLSRPNKKEKQTKFTTLLVVGEGQDDQAVIKHINQEFREDSAAIKPSIEKQSGGSPGNIITNAARKYEHIAYDKRYIVLDSDVPILQQDHDKARKHGYHIILWRPTSLEGALLDLLNENVLPHETSQQLKTRQHPRLDGKPDEPVSYRSLFPRTVLEQSRNASVNRVRDVLLGNP
ncbi:hypothetical protein [Parathalassolituus penaei]|uniref:RloB domain-containing protein n=1 Tax=Parathalassolituus penaei TaxID=2997323 RepID=A0A9X3ITG5_9GAMM|nr:hypothetical protein [Parathalassolituus penaei]MCY0965168.1 hypothetical protein [Parathalassolituus penaei]